MKKMLLVVLIPVGLFTLTQCESTQRWETREDYTPARHDRLEKGAMEDRFTAVQRRIDDYRRTVRLTDEEARDFQARLDAIRHDYTRVLEGNRFIQFNERDVSRSLHQLERDLERSQTREDYTPARHDRLERGAMEDRFTAVQRRIDDYRRTVRLTDEEARDYRVRLDAIRHDYTRVLDGNRFIQFNEKDVSRSLHQLEKDLDRHR